MSKWVLRIAGLSLVSVLMTSVMAQDESGQYEQKTLPDGSTETDSTDENGSQVKQIQHPDGMVETDVIDQQGNETITKQFPNGTVEVQNKKISEDKKTTDDKSSGN